MKKTIYLNLLAAISFMMTVNAQTVALQSALGAQIFKGNTSLADAYNAAQNGDTLYLSGGSYTPPAAFDKQLMIFGAGHYPDSTQVTGKTFITANFVLTENADGFYIDGLEITGNFIITTNHSVNNVVVKRCKINGTFDALGNFTNPTTNLALIGNVLVGRIDLQNVQNALLSNNIIQYTFQNSNGNLLNNNIIMSAFYMTSGPDFMFMGNNNTLNNNIFIYNNDDIKAFGTGNAFNYNLFVRANPDFGTGGTGYNNYTGVAQTSIFINQTGNIFDYAHNYHLQSPAIYVGNDGTEVGVYGGSFPYKEGAVPLNPHIQFKNIPATTDTNGNLQIQIQVEAQND
ncbi:MAG: hypothetical protein GYA62_15850 [Bacteroidales bacterium]|nr:hypothetical protein [Bacteroidales bacterium]